MARVAILAAGLEAHDPNEAYRLDLMTGTRERVQDKEVALSYVRKAIGYEFLTGNDLLTCCPTILDAVNCLGDPPEAALKRIAALLRRHGHSVAGVMRENLQDALWSLFRRTAC